GPAVSVASFLVDEADLFRRRRRSAQVRQVGPAYPHQLVRLAPRLRDQLDPGHSPPGGLGRKGDPDAGVLLRRLTGVAPCRWMTTSNGPALSWPSTTSAPRL